MPVVIWTGADARPVSTCRRASGVECSIAVVGAAGDFSLRFKLSLDGGTTWPADEAAVLIHSVDKRQAWFIVEAGAVLVVGNGIDKQYRSEKSGDDASHWVAA